MQKIQIEIGEVVNNCEAIAFDTTNKGEQIIIAECLECGSEIKVLGYKFKRGMFMCKHGIRYKAIDYIGKTIGTLRIDNITGSNAKGRSFVNHTCMNCGNIGNVELHRITSFNYICECQKRNKYEEQMINKYSEYIGKTIKGNEILDVKYYTGNVNQKAQFVLKCQYCGNIREVSVFSFLYCERHKQCNCRPKTREVKDPAKKYREIYLNKHFGLSKIIGFEEGTTLQNTEAICECKCGNIFRTMLTNIVVGDTKSCGCIKMSYGEYLIGETLKKLNVKFKHDTGFEDLRSEKGGRLRYDYIIYNSKSEVVGLIEYDGPHHSVPFTYSNEYLEREELQETLNSVKANDKLKDKYAQDNNYALLRIEWNRRITDDYIIGHVTNFITQLKL